MNYQENKEKDNTTDHEEIGTGTAMFPKICVFLIQLSPFISDLLFFFRCGLLFETIIGLCCEMSVRDRQAD